MNIQTEGMHAAEHVGRGMELAHPLWDPTLPALPRVHHLGSSPNTTIFEFLWRFHHVSIINH